MAAELKINISADIQNAITGFDEVISKANSLAGIKGIDIPVSIDSNIDTSKVDKTINGLKTGVDIPLKVDTSTVEKKLTSLQTSLKGFETVLKPKIDESGIKAALADVKNLIVVTANTSQAETELAELKTNSLFKGVNIPVRVDSNFEAVIKEIKSDIASLTTSAKIGINASEFESVLKRITDKIALLKGVNIDLTANPAQAEEAIRSVIQDIAGLRATELTLKADPTQALKMISLLSDELSSLKPKLTIDTTELKNQVGVVQSLLGSVEIKGDDSQITSVLKTVQGKLSALTSPTIDLKANPSLAEDSIKKVLTLISGLKSEEILLRADNTEALKAISAVEGVLNKLHASVAIDASGIQAKAKEIRDAFSKLNFTANVDINSAGVSSAIKLIHDKLSTLSDETVNISANAVQVEGVIREVTSLLAGLKGSDVSLTVSGGEAVETFITGLKGQLETLHGTVTVETDDLDGSIKRIQAALEPLSDSVDLQINAKQAEATIKDIQGRISQLKGVDVILDADGRNVIQTVNLIQKELIELEAKLKKAVDPKEILQLNTALLKVRDSVKTIQTGALSNSLKGLTGASSQATFALTNIGRVAQDLPFGFLGIANNITPLIESFQRLGVEAKQTGVSVGKQLLQSLKGGGGLILAFSGLSAVMSIATLGLSFFTRGMGGAKSGAKSAGDELKNFKDRINDLIRPINQIRSGGIGDAQGEIVQVQALANVVGNLSNSYTQRNNALNELQRINKNYFGDLTLEANQLGSLKLAVEEYTQALIAQSVQKAFLDDIGKVSKEFVIQGDVLRGLKKQFNDTYGLQIRATDASTKTTIEERRQKKELNAQIFNQQEAVSKLGSQYEILRDQVKEAALIASKFKPLSGGKDDFKDQTDDIIARARQFAKEFGDAFVVPNLEDSFFKTKQEILRLSKQLLDDVNNGRLKIKIPVQVDFELLPVEEFKLQQSTIDSFFEGIKIERSIPVNVTPDLTLSKGNIDAIDKKLDLRKQFSVLGDFGLDEFNKIDFTNINAGIAEATTKLEGMMAIATTLNQSIGQGLANAFNSVFDAVLEGKSVFKALGNAVKELIVTTIKAVAQMLILKLITNAIFPGGGGGFSLPRGQFFLSANTGNGNLFNIGQQIGSRSFMNTLTVNVNGQISGDTIRLAGQRAANSQGRSG